MYVVASPVSTARNPIDGRESTRLPRGVTYSARNTHLPGYICSSGQPFSPDPRDRIRMSAIRRVHRYVTACIDSTAERQKLATLGLIQETAPIEAEAEIMIEAPQPPLGVAF